MTLLGETPRTCFVLYEENVSTKFDNIIPYVLGLQSYGKYLVLSIRFLIDFEGCWL